MKKRLHWIDICKGVLIILMVLGHISNIAGKHGIDDQDLKKCIFFASIYGVFFMQAFFILTGYTSNFEKAIHEYLISIGKTLVLPWFSFSLVMYIFRGFDSWYVINNQHFFFLFEDFWFIHALVMSKIVYFFIRKYINKDLLRFTLLLGLTIIGFASFGAEANGNYESYYHVNNYLHIKDFCCMCIFLWIGDYLRRSQKMDMLLDRRINIYIIISLYMLGHVIRIYTHFNGGEIPVLSPVVLSHGTNIISVYQIPAFLYFTIFGSLSCFSLCKILKNSNFFEYFGKHSMVVYCVHFLFLELFVDIISIVVYPSGLIHAAIFTFLVLMLTIGACACVNKILEHKPFCYIIGRF